MVLKDVMLMDEPLPVSIVINDGKITDIEPKKPGTDSRGQQFTFQNAFAFPGLINSHEHLDFNLYPQLGNRTYSNYTEWGAYIHKNYKEEIAGVLKIPVELREQWGVYKNLICGVTTVVNHGEKTVVKDVPITIFEDTTCLHSVQFEKDWKVKLNRLFKRKQPISIHTGEGTDELAADEIDQLIKWNLMQKSLIGIHAVAMTESQARKFEAIVWCPDSNYFLLNKTAPVERLKKATKILFGTDSTLTACWDIWEHIRLADKTEKLSKAELYGSLNKTAAEVWRLNTGEIAAGKDADLVIIEKGTGQTSLEDFFQASPKSILLVVHKGNVRLFDETLYRQMGGAALKGFTKIYVNGVCKYVQGDVPGLMKSIRNYYPEARFPVNTDSSLTWA